MNAPPIEFARTSDGVSIAYGTVGEGKGLVYMQGIPTRHFSLLWKLSADDRQLAQLAAARERRWVMFDPRGMGSSAAVDSFSLDGFVSDLEAVADKLGLTQFDLVAATYSNPIAVEYAVRHPDRVSHLVLHYPFLRSVDALDTPAMAAVRALREQDWTVYTDASMHILFGNQSSHELARIMAQVLRAAITPERGRKVFQLVDQFDMTHQAARVEVPTLVITEPDVFIAEHYSRAVAAAIDSAQFILAETRERFANETWRFLGVLPDSTIAPSFDGAHDTASLTPRELEILALLVAGQSNRVIAEGLVLSERTVARHIANIYEKTGAHGRAEVTAHALRHRIV
jgi:DNA-binding NarL/FixJ family response regulator